MVLGFKVSGFRVLESRALVLDSHTRTRQEGFRCEALLKGSWDLVTRVIIRVTILITPIKVLITLLTKSHDPPSSVRQGSN